MSYLHCNLCYTFPKNKEITFYLMSCRDVLCQKCLTKGQPNICALCRKPAKATVIHDKMADNMRIFSKNTLAMAQATQNMEMIQLQQQMSFLCAGEHIQQKYEQKMKENEELRKMIQEKEGAFKKELALIKKVRVMIKNEEQNPGTSGSFSSSNVSSHSGDSSFGSLSFKSFDESMDVFKGDKRSDSGKLFSGKETTGSQPKSSKAPLVQGPFHRANASTRKSNIPVRGNRSIFSQGLPQPGPSNAKR